jgi:hypothetical protein
MSSSAEADDPVIAGDHRKIGDHWMLAFAEHDSGLAIGAVPAKPLA